MMKNTVCLFRNLYYLLRKFPSKLFNTVRIVGFPKNSYLFLQMSVKWKGTEIIPFNYGDDLNVFLIGRLTGKRILKYDEFLHFWGENILGIGSIIEYKCNNNSIVWGSGAMYGDFERRYTPKKVCALRGPLTKRYLEQFGVNCPEVFGDPALLLPLIYQPSKEKKYKLGIVPHYHDYNLPHVVKFREENPDILFINMQKYDNWHQVVDLIASCEMIASSSLHGMIISDAYYIPNIHVAFSKEIAGGNFKYQDYCEGVNRDYSGPLKLYKEIDVDRIIMLMSQYKNISFNPNILLETCPFPILPCYMNNKNNMSNTMQNFD